MFCVGDQVCSYANKGFVPHLLVNGLLAGGLKVLFNEIFCSLSD